MFREMRRKDKAMDNQQAQSIIQTSDYGVLGTIGEDGYPYTVPLNFVYFNDAIYFHSFIEGHKLENIKFNDKVSFNIVSKAIIKPEHFSTHYKSVVIFGRASVVEGQERRLALEELLKKYSSEYMHEGLEYLEKVNKITAVVKIEIEQLTGKATKE